MTRHTPRPPRESYADTCARNFFDRRKPGQTPDGEPRYGVVARWLAANPVKPTPKKP